MAVFFIIKLDIYTLTTQLENAVFGALSHLSRATVIACRPLLGAVFNAGKDLISLKYLTPLLTHSL